jgi:hypothetical protein
MKPFYTFHRFDGFYPVDMPDHPTKTPDEVALDCVPLNPGTLKVVNEMTGEVIYDVARQPNVES